MAISVTDTGIGIAEEDCRTCFGGGPASVLYLTRKIAREILHGDVVFRSKEGEGSVFTVTVPKYYKKQT